MVRQREGLPHAVLTLQRLARGRACRKSWLDMQARFAAMLQEIEGDEAVRQCLHGRSLFIMGDSTHTAARVSSLSNEQPKKASSPMLVSRR